MDAGLHVAVQMYKLKLGFQVCRSDNMKALETRHTSIRVQAIFYSDSARYGIRTPHSQTAGSTAHCGEILFRTLPRRFEPL